MPRLDKGEIRRIAAVDYGVEKNTVAIGAGITLIWNDLRVTHVVK